MSMEERLSSTHADEHGEVRDRLTAIETEMKVIRWMVGVGIIGAGLVVAILR